ncbi:MAG: protein phosphatase 2C domain-containing protein [Verrucomicrobiaceae bacterium]|nr:MAG: protein phosphatase 2C domain-containing protein [Verrucomicrobiaceae bacterium]
MGLIPKITRQRAKDVSSKEDAMESARTESPQSVGQEAPNVCSGILENFSLAGAAVQGPGHLRAGTPCDDRFAWHSSLGRVCAVVADGAGSAKLGRVGAESVSSILVRNVLETTNETPLTIEGVRAAVRAGVFCARRALATSHPQARLSDFHATVVGAVWDSDTCILFHIGDGVGAVIANDRSSLAEAATWEDALVSEPENGDSADQTYFFTMDPIRLRLKQVQNPLAVVLMTDGAASLCYTHQSAKLEGGFFSPIASYLARTNDLEKLASQLPGVMRSDQANITSDDDKCIIIAIRGNSRAT